MKYLALVLCVFLMSCGKEDTVTEAPEPAVIENSTLTFYIDIDAVDNIDLPVQIYLDDSLVEDYLNSAPYGGIDCKAPGALGRPVHMSPGWHHWKTLSDNPLWGDSAWVTVVDGECRLIKLQ